MFKHSFECFGEVHERKSSKGRLLSSLNWRIGPPTKRLCLEREDEIASFQCDFGLGYDDAEDHLFLANRSLTAIIGLAKTAEHCCPNEHNACHSIQVLEQTGSYGRVARAAAIYGPVDTTTTLPASITNTAMAVAAATSGASDVVSDEASDGDVAIANRAIIAHGTIMAFTFVIVFPLGALLIRVASIKGLVWVHAAVQGFGYILAFTGLGLGTYIAIVPTFQVCPHPLLAFSGWNS